MASVSFDRKKNAFKYSAGLENVFGKEIANQMKAKQGSGGVTKAGQKFKEADEQSQRRRRIIFFNAV